MAFSCEFYDIGETDAYFDAVFTGGDSSFTEYRYVKLSVDGRTIQIRSKSAGGSSSYFSYHLTGLDEDTRYSWTAQLGYDAGGIVWMDVYDNGSFRTEAAPLPQVEPWDWNSSNGSASATQTRNFYQSLLGNRSADNMSHLVWNDFVDKVAEMRSALGMSWGRTDIDGTSLPSASGCKVDAGETLSANKYNGVRYNIGSVMSSGIGKQDRGDKITGNLITILASTLNSIIETMINS